MNLFKIVFFYIFLFLLTINIVFSQEIEQPKIAKNQFPPLLNQNTITNPEVQVDSSLKINSTTILDTSSIHHNKVIYPPVDREFRRLGYNTSIYIGTTVIAFGILWAMPESVSNWDKEEIKEKGFLWKWKQNVKAGPVLDQDDWILNYVTHPYSGAVYYMTARSSGFNIFESFMYSTFMSTFFWEYGIEAFAEIPSKQDLVITPVLGSIVGEGFFYAKKSILKHDRRVLKSKASAKSS